MASRALIIAIEEYAQATAGIANALPGTLQAGLDFRAWLNRKWDAEGLAGNDRQMLFCSSPRQADGEGATQQDLFAAMDRLKASGRNQTDELFVFFSGHGFAFVEKPTGRADVIMTADYVSRQMSPHCCLKIDEIVEWFRTAMGPGCHYYFVDACRNAMDPTQVNVGTLPPGTDFGSGDPSTFLLHSTTVGAIAAVGGAFPQALLAGLGGAGKAKVWGTPPSDAMFVRFESLRMFIKSRMHGQSITHRMEGEKGESEVVLATIRPIPKAKLVVNLVGARVIEPGTITIVGEHAPSTPPLRVDRWPQGMDLPADRYTVTVELRDVAITPDAPIGVELYDDATLNYRINAAPPPLPPVVPPPLVESAGTSPEGGFSTKVEVQIPTGTTYRMRDIETGEQVQAGASGISDVRLGRRYAISVRDRNNEVVSRKVFEATPEPDQVVAPTSWGGSKPHESIASHFPLESGSAVWFSESLGGSVADPDLDVWLALLGGGRILAGSDNTDFSKIAPLPLQNFESESADSAPIYVLAGFEDADQSLRVGLSTGGVVNWSAATRPGDMDGVLEWRAPTQAGPQLLWLQRGDDAPYTVASFTTPNRAMLVTLTLDEDGEFVVSQYLLPLGRWMQRLPQEVAARLTGGASLLGAVLTLARMSRAFRKRRPLERDIGNDQLSRLLDFKWVDPIGSTMAGYELLRRGKRDLMKPVVIPNMDLFFPDLPDTRSLHRMVGDRVQHNGTPLFLDGLRAFPGYAQWLPLPAAHLDFTSMWTAWRDAKSSGALR